MAQSMDNRSTFLYQPDCWHTEGRSRLSWLNNGHQSQEWESLEHLTTTGLEQLTPYFQEKLGVLYMQAGCLYPTPTQVGR